MWNRQERKEAYSAGDALAALLSSRTARDLGSDWRRPRIAHDLWVRPPEYRPHVHPECPDRRTPLLQPPRHVVDVLVVMPMNDHTSPQTQRQVIENTEAMRNATQGLR